MSKYIRTYYENKKSIIKMEGCQHCPLMRFDRSLFMSECRYFRSSLGNVVKDFVVVYSKNQHRVMENITPPVWCKLPNTLDEMSHSKDTYTVTQIGIRCDTMDGDMNLSLLDATDLTYDVNNVTNYGVMLPSPLESSYRPDNGLDLFRGYGSSYVSGYGSRALERHYNTMTAPVVKHNKCCSLCGEEDESVDRNTNLGMCEYCFEISKDDEPKLNQAYINNFRLKRNVKVDANIQFKMLKEININYDGE